MQVYYCSNLLGTADIKDKYKRSPTPPSKNLQWWEKRMSKQNLILIMQNLVLIILKT